MVRRVGQIGLAVLASAAAALTVDAAGAQTSRTLNVVSWGGAYAESQRKAYIEPYRLKHPEIAFSLLNSGGDPVEKLRAQVLSGNVTWDLVDVVAADAIRLCKEGIALPVGHDNILAPAPDGTPASQDFGQTIVSECFIPQIVYSTTFGYRTDRFKTAPTSLCDIFDLKRFPGKRALERRPINNLEWALLCDGVPVDKVYETLETGEGVERALKKLATIKAMTIWWSDGNEPVDRLAKGEVVFASAYNGRLFALITQKKRKVPVAMLWNWQAFDFDGWIIPKGTKHITEVLNFVRFATDTERLAKQASYISYGPARRSSNDLVGKHAELGIDMKPHLPTAPENAKSTLIYNYDWWAQNRDRLDVRFRIWLAAK